MSDYEILMIVFTVIGLLIALFGLIKKITVLSKASFLGLPPRIKVLTFKLIQLVPSQHLPIFFAKVIFSCLF